LFDDVTDGERGGIWMGLIAEAGSAEDERGKYVGERRPLNRIIHFSSRELF
jgi:hypothetical protein